MIKPLSFKRPACRAFHVRCGPARCRAVAAAEPMDAAMSSNNAESNGVPANESHEHDFEDAYDVATLSLEQVQILLGSISEGTKIAEVHLKLQDLEVRFKRSAGDVPSIAPQPAVVQPSALPGPLPMMADFGGGAGSSTEDGSSVDVASMDESENFSVVPVASNKVGIFRRCKYVNTKKLGSKPLVSEGNEVLERQQIAFIEQLGTFSPVEAPMDGQIVKVLVEEGEPVEFDQTLFEMVPRMASSGSRIK